MAQDLSEKTDEYCLENYGHTNWGYKSSYTEKELQDVDCDIEGGIVFFHQEDEIEKYGDVNQGLGTWNGYEYVKTNGGQ